MRDRRNTTIMVVDDDPSMRITLADVIEDEGFGVVRAKDGRQAIEIARKMPISVIFMDFKIPGINGVEAFKVIKELSPDTIVVMMTSFPSDGLVEQCVEEGAHSVIYKPFPTECVTEIIADLLPIHSVARTTERNQLAQWA